MRFSLFAITCCLFLSISCTQEKSLPETPVTELKLQYDTTAIDSFSPGAISVDVAQQIRMSSKKYVDSLKAVAELERQTKEIDEAIMKEKKEEENKQKNVEKSD